MHEARETYVIKVRRFETPKDLDARARGTSMRSQAGDRRFPISKQDLRPLVKPGSSTHIGNLDYWDSEGLSNCITCTVATSTSAVGLAPRCNTW